MSEAKVLNSGAVTTLADNDLVVACDSGGTMRPISVSNLLALVRGSLQVGGRNLLKNTGNYSVTSDGMYWFGSKLTKPVTELRVPYPLTFSCKYRKTGSPSGNVVLGALITSSFYDQVSFSAASLPESGVLVKTFSTNVLTYNGGDFSIFVNGVAGVTLYDFKLERGNVATDWTPAPEDLGWGGGKRHILNYLRLFGSRSAERRVAV